MQEEPSNNAPSRDLPISDSVDEIPRSRRLVERFLGVRKSTAAKRLDEYSSSISRGTKLVATLALIYVLIGTFYYPEWWYTLFFAGGLFDYYHWSGATDYLLYKFGILVTVLLLFLAFRWLLPSRIRTRVARYWEIAKESNNGRTGFYLRFILIILLVMRFSTINESIENQRVHDSVEFAQSMERSNPLTRPTSFILLSKDSVDSLYGQYEPDLVPAVVIAEIKSSTSTNAHVNFDQFLQSDVGKVELQRRLTEYRQTPKNSERKLGDLLRFLIEKSLSDESYLKRYGDLERKSEGIKKLDDAIEVLRSEYHLSVDAKQLTVVRDQLLAEEIQRLVNELKQLHGLVLVEGDWSVESQPDSYILKRAFVENVTDSPTCETRIEKSAVSSQNKEIIESLKGERMRLSVFGSVITGMSTNSKSVRINPIAIF
jgi:hypothetical protein